MPPGATRATGRGATSSAVRRPEPILAAQPPGRARPDPRAVTRATSHQARLKSTISPAIGQISRSRNIQVLFVHHNISTCNFLTPISRGSAGPFSDRVLFGCRSQNQVLARKRLRPRGSSGRLVDVWQKALFVCGRWLGRYTLACFPIAPQMSRPVEDRRCQRSGMTTAA